MPTRVKKVTLELICEAVDERTKEIEEAVYLLKGKDGQDTPGVSVRLLSFRRLNTSTPSFYKNSPLSVGSGSVVSLSNEFDAALGLAHH